MNIILQLEFELAYYNVTAEHINHNTTEASPICILRRKLQLNHISTGHYNVPLTKPLPTDVRNCQVLLIKKLEKKKTSNESHIVPTASKNPYLSKLRKGHHYKPLFQDGTDLQGWECKSVKSQCAVLNIQARHAGHCWGNKDKLISIYLLSTDTRCCLVDLPRVMTDRDRSQKKVKRIHVISIPWWWGWIDSPLFYKRYSQHILSSKTIWFGLVWFYGISTIVSHSMPNLFLYT